MDEYFLKRGAEAAKRQPTTVTCCMMCGTDVEFPPRSHDGDTKLCHNCGKKVELKHSIGVLCRFCYNQVMARERDIGNEFKCPVCGHVMELELSDINGSDQFMIIENPDLFGLDRVRYVDKTKEKAHADDR